MELRLSCTHPSLWAHKMSFHVFFQFVNGNNNPYPVAQFVLEIVQQISQHGIPSADWIYNLSKTHLASLSREVKFPCGFAMSEVCESLWQVNTKGEKLWCVNSGINSGVMLVCQQWSYAGHFTLTHHDISLLAPGRFEWNVVIPF